VLHADKQQRARFPPTIVCSSGRRQQRGGEKRWFGEQSILEPVARRRVAGPGRETVVPIGGSELNDRKEYVKKISPTRKLFQIFSKVSNANHHSESRKWLKIFGHSLLYRSNLNAHSQFAPGSSKRLFKLRSHVRIHQDNVSPFKAQHEYGFGVFTGAMSRIGIRFPSVREPFNLGLKPCSPGSNMDCLLGDVMGLVMLALRRRFMRGD
jgi:hypothetical protein